MCILRHLCENIHRVWKYPVVLIFWCQLLKQFWRMDGRTWKKGYFFWKKILLVRTNPSRMDISIFWMYFSVLSDAVRTVLNKKKVWRKKAFAYLRYMGKFSKDKLPSKLSNIPACPQLSIKPTLIYIIIKEQCASKTQGK